MKNLKFRDPDFVLMCALDYVVNRQTYAPEMLAEEIDLVWDDLKENTKTYIKNRIKESGTKNEKLLKILEK